MNERPIVEYSDIDGAAPYDPTNRTLRANQHIGQRKLFLNEIQFLARCFDTQRPTLVVYAGGTPSNKTGSLAELCPSAVFLLVDPNPFAVFPPTSWDKTSPFGPDGSLPRMLIFGSEEDGLARSRISKELIVVREAFDTLGARIADGAEHAPTDPRARIFLFNTYYTPEHSAALRKAFNGERILFVSDIRTAINETSSPADLDICWNAAQQYIWTAILGAEASMLKWRHPHRNPGDTSMDLPNKYTLEDFRIAAAGKYRDELGQDHDFAPIDFQKDYAEGVLRFVVGRVFIQPWARPSSAETRLVIESAHPEVAIHPRDYGDRLFWYNSRLRGGPRRNPALDGASQHERTSLGMDHCNDCALEAEIWGEYVTKKEGYCGPADVGRYVGMLIGATGNRPLHPRNYVARIR
jgi:hypothetical protein